jgi:hypothetical protein
MWHNVMAAIIIIALWQCDQWLVCENNNNNENGVWR